MKRLTYKIDGVWRIKGVNGKLVSDIYGNHSGEAVDRLAEYEDTGLEPKDIQEAVDLFKDFKDADIPKELKSWVERCTWHARKCEELLRELDKYKDAEEQGLLVRLPCKVGDTKSMNT